MLRQLAYISKVCLKLVTIMNLIHIAMDGETLAIGEEEVRSNQRVYPPLVCAEASGFRHLSTVDPDWGSTLLPSAAVF